MSSELSTRPEIATSYTRPSTRETLLAEAFSCILNGRPFPETLRAPSYVSPRPASCEEGIRRMLADPRLA
jgi:hypothetical protein